MRYAEYDDVILRYDGDASSEKVESLLDESALIIDAYNSNAPIDAKKIVSVRMVVRALGMDADIPVGASQGSMSALGYSQSWTIGQGTVGELYLTKTEKKLLGVGARIGSHSPLEDME